MKFKRKFSILFSTLPIFGMCVVVPNLTSCSQSNDVTITFKEETTGVHLETKTVVVKKGTLFKDVPLPKYTLDDGYYFNGWRINNRIIKPTEIVGGNVTISAWAGKYCNDGDFAYSVTTRSEEPDVRYAAMVYIERDVEDVVVPAYVKDKDGTPVPVREIGHSFLTKITKLKSLFFPHTVTAFLGPLETHYAKHLNSMVIDPNNELFTSRDKDGKEANAIIRKEGNVLVSLVIPEENGRNAIIPNGVKTMENEIFAFNSLVKTATIPSSLESISEKAFKDSSIEYIEFPETLEMIGEQAFHNCFFLKHIKLPRSKNVNFGPNVFAGSSLSSVNVPAEMDAIPNLLFNKCDMLSSVNIEYGISYIGENAFSECKSLRHVTIPKTVTSIGSGAFRGCTKLLSVDIPQTIKKIEATTFFNCPQLADVVLPRQLEAIGDNAFERTGITYLEIPQTLESIGFAAFANCPNLKKITINPDNKVYSSRDKTSGAECNCITQDNKIIVGCSTTTFPSQCTIIDDGAFFGATMDELKISDHIVEISQQAFSGCTFTKLHIGSGVKTIDQSAFAQTANRLNITVDPNNQHYTSQDGNNAECNCLMDKNRTRLLYATAITTIPSTVKKICTNAYSDINGPVDLVLPEGITTLETGSFVNLKNTQSLTFPESLTEIQEQVFEHCDPLSTFKIKRDLVNKGWPELWSNQAIYEILRKGTVYTPNSVDAKPIILQHWLLLNEWEFKDLT